MADDGWLLVLSVGISQIPGAYCFSSRKLPKNKKGSKKGS